MTFDESLTDAAILANAILAAGAGEPRQAQLALACLARNRKNILPRLGGLEFGFGSLAAACRSVANEAVYLNASANVAGAAGSEQLYASENEYYQALEIACQVLAGDCADPTAGAVLFHRHDVQPSWAIRRRPIALLGSYLFYRLD